MGSSAGFNLTTGNNNIYIGNARGGGDECAKIRIGTVGTQKATFIAGITGATVPGGVGVIVGNNGKLGTVVSSERFKDAIKPMNKASEAILALKPVTFRYKQELDPDGIPQFGLVAEDVEKVNSDLVARDKDGKPYTVLGVMPESFQYRTSEFALWTPIKLDPAETRRNLATSGVPLNHLVDREFWVGSVLMLGTRQGITNPVAHAGTSRG